MSAHTQLDYLRCSQPNYRGWHVLFDYRFELHPVSSQVNRRLAQAIFNCLQTVCRTTHLNVIHKKLIILDKATPLGFVSVLLLDESHVTAHCYTELGLLAIDVFSCGENSAKKTRAAADAIHRGISELPFDDLEFIRLDCPRFPYRQHDVPCLDHAHDGG